MNDPSLTLRPAEAVDAPLIFSLVSELAAYDRMTHAFDANQELIKSALFSQSPKVFCSIAERNGNPVGFVHWYYTFSSFRGRHGIWIDDLYVRERFRGTGVGRTLLASLARRCIEENLSRLEWAVLSWNSPSIRFFEAAGARLMEEWTLCRLDGLSLHAYAEEASRTSLGDTNGAPPD
jgi:GNAT superfamily N-acetyltransferase